MEEDINVVQVVLALISLERLLKLLARDQYRLEMGPTLIVYGDRFRIAGRRYPTRAFSRRALRFVLRLMREAL
jgi:hypothetical protein